MISWKSDNKTVRPVILAAKRSLLHVLLQIMPPENANQSLYCLVLEYGDFGIYNTWIKTDANGKLFVTFLCNWETRCFVPAIWFDPLATTGPVNSLPDKTIGLSVNQISKSATPPDLETYTVWARYYIKVRYFLPSLKVI